MDTKAGHICILALPVLCLLLMSVKAEIYTERLFSLGKYVQEAQSDQDITQDLIQSLEERPLTALYIDSLQDLNTQTPEESGNISRICREHLNLTLIGITKRQTWALSMIDAVGKLPAGVLTGDILWVGFYDECVNVTATVYAGPNQTLPTNPFKGKYCKAGIPLQEVGPTPGVETTSIPPGYATFGMCVPSSCSAIDVKVIVKSILSLLRVKNNTLDHTIAVCQKDHLEIDLRAAFAITILGILAALVVVGTIYDIFVIHKLHVSSELDDDEFSEGDETEPLVSNRASNIHSNNLNIRFRGYGTGDIPDRLVSPINKNIQDSQETQIGLTAKILQAFSVYTNGSKLLSTNTQSGNLEPVNGIRFISLSWVILGHSYAFILYDGKNTYPFIQKKLEDFSFMFMINATVSVDSFFLLSGLLVSYLSLKELKKVGGVKKFRWVLFYFHRFWRLTPPYGLVMLLYIPLLKYWSDGPFWPQDGVENNYCAGTWYRSLLYINNFFSASNTCMVWGWYLANDMQFYILSPLFLIPLYWSGVLGTLICCVGLLGCWISAGAISSINNYPMTLFGGVGGVGTNNILGYFDDLYVKPYTRIGPYIVGILLGYVLYVTECKPKLTRVQNLFGWLLATVCCLSVLYGNYGHISGKAVSGKHVIALYTALSRSVWGLGVAWVIYACATRHGGIINSFLSWKLFVPLSRLTYMAYLIHPVIIEAYYLSKREPTYISDLEVAYFFFGHLLVSYAVAFVLSLVFESPFMGLEKALLKRERKH